MVANRQDWLREQEHSAIKGFDALHNVKRLRMTRSMSNKEAELIFSTMVRQVRTYDQVVELLTYLPMHFGGLIPIANGLIHPLESVRNDCLDLLRTIKQYTVSDEGERRQPLARAMQAANVASRAGEEPPRWGRSKEQALMAGRVARNPHAQLLPPQDLYRAPRAPRSHACAPESEV